MMINAFRGQVCLLRIFWRERFAHRSALPRVIILATLGFLHIAPANAQNVWDRAKQIGRGVTINWLARPPSDIDLFSVSEGDVRLMEELGFRSVRIPMALDYWSEPQSPFRIDPSYLARLDSVISWVRWHGLSIILSYHRGQLADSTWREELPRIEKLWNQIADRYDHISADSLFIDIYNEPQKMTIASWREFACRIVENLRVVLPLTTFIIEPVMWNHITDNVTVFRPLSDLNCIYSFHFYEPFIFTHQGAPNLPSMKTIGIPYPFDATRMPSLDDLSVEIPFAVSQYSSYPANGNRQYVLQKLAGAKAWSVFNKVPVHCGEFGVFKAAPVADRVRWLRDVRLILDSLEIPWIHWEWKYQFSLFIGSPSHRQLYPGIAEALALLPTPFEPYIDSDSDRSLFGLFPNPAASYAFLRIPEGAGERSEIEVFDVLGRKVGEERKYITAGNIREVYLNTRSLNSGTYYVRTVMGGDITTFRLVVAR